jgi:hypothetical protein
MRRFPFVFPRHDGRATSIDAGRPQFDKLQVILGHG